MTNEDQLHIAVGRAARADALLKDELLTEAFKQLEGSYIAMWRSSFFDDTAGREKLFLAINVIGKVRDHLTKIVSDGHLAETELRKIVEAAERKKQWHEIK